MKMPTSLRFLFIAVFCSNTLLAPAPAAAVDLFVDAGGPTDATHFTTIQSAIDYANTQLISNPTSTLSYTVTIEPGTHAGGITLRNKISLRGRETMRTFVTGGGAAAITADNVTGVTIQNLTFLNAQTGIAISNTSTITVTNNVFIGAAAAVQVSGTSSNFIFNNTFYNNNIAVSRASENVFVTNNIFSNNQQNISQLSTLSQNNITFNVFHPAPAPGAVMGSDYLPDATNSNPDPLFVAPSGATPDLHLTAGSPCIDRGSTDKFDPYLIFDTKTSTTPATNRSDIGAYGGAEADTIPAFVSGITTSATASAPYAITVSWTASTNYLVGGYKVYYGSASKTYTGADAKDGSGGAVASPVDAKTATTLTLHDLAPASSTPAAPVLSTPQPRNGALVVSWSPVPGAASYTVHYGINDTSEQTLAVGNVISATIPNLTNGQSYKIAVSATAQSTYYITVTAYDKSGQTSKPGESHESAYAPEETKSIGPQYTSGFSNEVAGIPELLAPYPTLPNSGCFIATAAYGSADVAPVRALRSFRDRFLLKTPGGRTFVRWYYEVSPPVAAFLNDHPDLKPLVRAFLAPVVLAASILNALPLLGGVFLLGLIAGIALLLRRSRRNRRRSVSSILS